MTEILPLFAAASALLYALIAALLQRTPKPQAITPRSRPRVAVLVAMRNEEEHIGACLNALAHQTYPEDHYEVFVLDDRSEDRSAAIAAEFARRFDFLHVRAVTEDRNGLHGKMNALSQGLHSVEHDLVLITDADCVVPETWIETMVSYFDEHTGMVGGLTVLFPFDTLTVPAAPTSMWAKIQALDWIFLQAMAAANSRFGKPITILGNNFGFRTAAYREVGGFEALGFSVTEDFALMEALRKRTNWKVRHTLDKKSAIYSRPVPTIKDFFAQRLRWVKGGRRARPWGIFILGFSVLAHSLVAAGVVLTGENPLSWLALLLLPATDALIIAPVLKKLRLQKLWPAFPLFEAFYFIYLWVFSIVFFWPFKVRWKGRTF